MVNKRFFIIVNISPPKKIPNNPAGLGSLQLANSMSMLCERPADKNVILDLGFCF
jgi:hypothetical protein